MARRTKAQMEMAAEFDQRWRTCGNCGHYWVAHRYDVCKGTVTQTALSTPQIVSCNCDTFTEEKE